VTEAGGAPEELLGLADLSPVGENHSELARGVGLSGPGPAPKRQLVSTIRASIEIAATGGPLPLGEQPTRPDRACRDHATKHDRRPQEPR